MLLSRFWYILLAVSAAAAAGAALLSQGIINNKAAETLSDSLRRDRLEFEAVLRMEARGRLDRIAFIGVDGKLGALLKQAGGQSDEKTLSKWNAEAKDLLRGHVKRMVDAAGSGARESDLAPDIAFAVDQQGRILAQLGPLEVNPPGASLATYPLVDRALHGYVRDDLWVYDRRVYRMAARPIMYGGEFAGAIVHGYKFDNAFAQKLSEGLGGATLAFFYGTNVLASYTPGEPGAPQVAEIASALPQALTDERFKAGERTEPVALQSGGRGVFSLMVGSAAASNVGYAIARPLHLIGAPQEIFENASRQDIEALPLPMLGGGALLAALLGLLFVYLERDRPYKILIGKIAEIASGERDRLVVTEWRGAYRRLSDQVNQAIDKAVERAAEMSPSTKKKANLDEILGPTPQSSSEPYFGFAMDAEPAASKPALTASAPQKVAPPSSPALKPAPTPPQAMPRGPLASPLPPSPLPPTAAAPALPRPPQPQAAAAPVSTSLPSEALMSVAAEAFDEPAHFRETFEQYVATRKQCGEATEGLTFEKFEVTLTKTRDQVLAKSPGKAVRFSVYVKDGKAALKASQSKK